MNKIPIFDSLTHPTIDGNWILPRYPSASRVEDLVSDMHLNNIKWAFAVGMRGIGNYEEKRFISMLSPMRAYLLPVAFFPSSHLKTSRDIKDWATKIRDQGYIGVKFHPRFGGFSLDSRGIIEGLNVMAELKLIPLLCTYFYDSKASSSIDNLALLQTLLAKLADPSIILMHSGTVRVLETLEIARNFKNTLMDLSFTLCKYQDSSLDLDIKYLFRNFDKRICVGSDHPEFTLKHFRSRFEEFSENIPSDKVENISHKNLIKFINGINHEIKF